MNEQYIDRLVELRKYITDRIEATKDDPSLNGKQRTWLSDERAGYEIVLKKFDELFGEELKKQEDVRSG